MSTLPKNMGQGGPKVNTDNLMDMRPKEDRLIEQALEHLEKTFCSTHNCKGVTDPHPDCHRCQALAIFEELKDET